DRAKPHSGFSEPSPRAPALTRRTEISAHDCTPRGTALDPHAVRARAAHKFQSRSPFFEERVAPPCSLTLRRDRHMVIESAIAAHRALADATLALSVEMACVGLHGLPQPAK